MTSNGETNLNAWVDERFPSGADSVKNWMNRLSPRTAIDNAYTFLRWISWVQKGSPKWANFTPDDLINYQEAAPNGDRFNILNEIQKYVNQNGGRYKTKSTYYTALRSFFLHNRVELPADPSFRIRSDIAPVQSQLTLDIFKEVVMGSNECYAAVWMCMYQSGMGLAELIYWSENGYADLMEQLKDDPELVKISIPGRKHNKNQTPFYTFIGRDAIRFLRNWLKNRPPDVSDIFVNQYKTNLTQSAMRGYWTRKLKRLGHIVQKGEYRGNRYGMNPHEIRDLFRSRWRISGVDPMIAEWMMGHKEGLDRFGYDKSPWHNPEWYEDQYNEAQAWLNIMSENPQTVPRKEIDILRRENEELRRKVERFSNVEVEVSEIKAVIRELQAKMKNL